MDQSISAVIGAVIFAWFTIGLAESIGAIPFIVIVGLVIVLMTIDVVQLVKDRWNPKDSNQSSK